MYEFTFHRILVIAVILFDYLNEYFLNVSKLSKFNKPSDGYSSSLR